MAGATSPAAPAAATAPATPAAPAAVPSTPVRRPRPASSTRSTSSTSSSSGERTSAVLRSTAGSIAGNGGGFLLALLAWGWIGLPFLRGGPNEVRNVLRAKFTNKGPDGSWLP